MFDWASNELSKLDICVDLRFDWGEVDDEGDWGDEDDDDDLTIADTADETGFVNLSLTSLPTVVTVLVLVIELGMFWIVFVTDTHSVDWFELIVDK